MEKVTQPKSRYSREIPQEVLDAYAKANEAVCCQRAQWSGHPDDAPQCCCEPVAAVHVDEAVARDLGVAVFRHWDTLFAVSEKGPSEEAYQRVLKSNADLRLALQQCVAVVEMWHGGEAFDLYFNNSPEMQVIRNVLGPMEESKNG